MFRTKRLRGLGIFKSEIIENCLVLEGFSNREDGSKKGGSHAEKIFLGQNGKLFLSLAQIAIKGGRRQTP